MALKETVSQWKAQAAAASDAHFAAARHAEHLHWWLGLSATFFSAVVGCGILVSLNASPSYLLKLVAVVISLLAATLSSINTLTDSAKRGAAHVASGNEFDSVCKKCEVFLCPDAIDKPSYKEIESSFSTANKTAAVLPAKFASLVLNAKAANNSFETDGSVAAQLQH